MERLVGKKEQPQVCPKCGGTSFMNTSEGIMCKNCKMILNDFTPITPKAEDNE